MSLSGKVALVTGSTSGIGLGIAERLASASCDVIITGFGEQSVIDGIVERIKSNSGVGCQFLGADLKDETSITEMCRQVQTLYPAGVDILVNNAGFQHVCPIDEYPVSVWHDMIAVQLTAPFLLIKHCLPYMKNKGWGRIVNTSSQMGLISAPGKVPYSVVKSGLIGLTKGTALECAEFEVTVNAICPGFVETDLVKQQIADIAKEKSITYEKSRTEFFNRHPNKKPISVEEVAHLVHFLCSPEAGSITGSSYSIDAGYTAQ